MNTREKQMNASKILFTSFLWMALLLSIFGCGGSGGSNGADDAGDDSASGDLSGGDSDDDSDRDSDNDSDGDSDVDSCSDVTACGGDVVGDWTAVSSCLTLSGQLDVSGMGANCAYAPVEGTLLVTGTWTANADGSCLEDLSCSGEEQLTFAPECFRMSEAIIDCYRLEQPVMGIGYFEGLEYSSVGCEGESAYEPECTCAGVVDRDGDSASGTYTASDGVVTTSGGLAFSYCVTGDTMIMTPRKWSSDTSVTITGTVVLKRQP
jgi:hypothetical protein